MKLTFLGTGAGMPSKERNVSAIALSLLQESNSVWLFDCGEGTQHQILHTSIKPRKVNKIFITHLHGDHIFGLPGFLSSRSFQDGDKLTIYGPKGIKQYVEASLAISETHLSYPLHIVELFEGKILETKQFNVYCKKLDHGIPSYGFRIEEKDRPGKLQVDKLKALGISPGPIYKEIIESETYTLPNGTIIERKQVLGPTRPGRIVSILGDTIAHEQYHTFIKNSDVLVHEATFSKDHEDLAKKYHHSTTKQAAQLAKLGTVKKLILTHISSRYQEQDYALLLDEAKQIFKNTVLATDFYEEELIRRNS